MNMFLDRMFVAGPCPVCAVSLGLICFWSIADSKLFYACPMCEVAWAEYPSDESCEFLELHEVAGGGVRLASHQEVLGEIQHRWTEVHGPEKEHQAKLIRASLDAL